MTRHLLQIDGRTVLMKVEDFPNEIVCEVSFPCQSGSFVWTGWSPAQYEFVYAWFTAIIEGLRKNSPKTIHLFDRQHVMTS